jgi:hypothetical protein
MLQVVDVGLQVRAVLMPRSGVSRAVNAERVRGLLRPESQFKICEYQTNSDSRDVYDQGNSQLPRPRRVSFKVVEQGHAVLTRLPKLVGRCDGAQNCGIAQQADKCTESARHPVFLNGGG